MEVRRKAVGGMIKFANFHPFVGRGEGKKEEEEGGGGEKGTIGFLSVN